MPPSHKLQLDQPARYTIQAQGRLAEHWLATFDPMIATVTVDEYGHAVTTLCGLLLDQAALHGLLRSLYALGMPLLLVRWEPEVGATCSENSINS